MLQQGQPAPDFELLNQADQPVRLSDFRGQTVILYFYPKDQTPGCTKEACGFAAAWAAFKAQNAVILGVSKDSTASHRRFADKESLPFTLLSDPDHKVMEAYGVWQEKKNYGKVYWGTVRSTFLIGPDGLIQKVWPKVKPEQHAAEILAWLKA
ncbi:MAG: thioredoxin-dependent thiol peroxidase [Oscillospiraceae bacterium]|nr:thioredoxin-dependent thiol peroxidase [Oscillospiraceae bacterium]MDD4368296.1 thioredoxin-dependent thiol peroxidase [Oscillospiraceae bacterium]